MGKMYASYLMLVVAADFIGGSTSAKIKYGCNNNPAVVRLSRPADMPNSDNSPDESSQPPSPVPAQGNSTKRIYKEGIGGYTFHRANATWDEARGICQAEGADLAVPNFAAELDFLVELIKQSAESSQRSAWISIYDNEGRITNRNQRLKETGFSLLSGLDTLGNRCAMINGVPIIDYYCSDKRNFICELTTF